MRAEEAWRPPPKKKNDCWAREFDGCIGRQQADGAAAAKRWKPGSSFQAEAGGWARLRQTFGRGRVGRRGSCSLTATLGRGPAENGRFGRSRVQARRWCVPLDGVSTGWGVLALFVRVLAVPPGAQTTEPVETAEEHRPKKRSPPLAVHLVGV